MASKGKFEGVKVKDLPAFPSSFHLGDKKNSEFIEKRRFALEIFLRFSSFLLLLLSSPKRKVKKLDLTSLCSQRALATPSAITKNLTLCTWLLISETVLIFLNSSLLFISQYQFSFRDTTSFHQAFLISINGVSLLFGQ